MDAYFASVEQAHRPHLRDKPVIVTADPYGNPKGRRSVVAAASYEAKQSGVKSGMPLFEALKLCPQAFLVEGNADKYQTLTCQLISILSRFSHQIEVYSIDEAFLDVTQTHHLFSGAAKVGEVIRALVKKKLNITCSIGVAPNKLVAKVASSLRKPDALVVVAPDDLPEMLWPLPVDRIPGVGPRRKLKLKIMSIKTVGEIAYFPLSLLRSNFGSWGEVYIQCSLGKRRHSCNFSDSSIQIYRAFHYFKRKPSSARRSSSCPSLPC
jgi:DNA polymerase-4